MEIGLAYLVPLKLVPIQFLSSVRCSSSQSLFLFRAVNALCEEPFLSRLSYSYPLNTIEFLAYLEIVRVKHLDLL